jgi:hypothetical protein
MNRGNWQSCGVCDKPANDDGDICSGMTWIKVWIKINATSCLLDSIMCYLQGYNDFVSLVSFALCRYDIIVWQILYHGFTYSSINITAAKWIER